MRRKEKRSAAAGISAGSAGTAEGGAGDGDGCDQRREAGEADQFAEALQGAAPGEELRRRMQLKTLLFGMGETFRALLQRKGEEEAGKGEA